MARTPTANVDGKALEHLDAASSGKPESIVFFIKDGHFARSISAWAYFLSVNDHSLFIETSVKLARLSSAIKNVFVNEKVASDLKEGLQAQLELMEMRPQIVERYQEILQSHSKILYRALNNNRPAITNPILRLMLNIVTFQSSLATVLIDNFDLNLTVLPNLLVPPKGQDGPISQSHDHLNTRHNFIRFWIALTTSVPSHIRKDLLVNKPKIMNNLWKFMAGSDSIGTLLIIIEWIESAILKEASFKRSTKCKILNENFMFKLQLLFNRLQDATFTSQFIQFVKSFTSSSEGLLFPNNQCLLTTNYGTPLNVNGKSFKVHNKLLFTFLTTLKPCETFQQLAIVTEFLTKCPELIAPYLNWCVQTGGGYHDPSLTSWWIGRSLLFTEILKIKLPVESSNSGVLDISLLFECLCPAPLSKASFLKGIESKIDLCLQISRQLLLLVLSAVKSLQHHLTNVQKSTLCELVFDMLPEVEQIGQALKNDSQAKQDKLRQLTALKIVQLYEELYPLSIARPSGFSLVSKVTHSNITAMVLERDVSEFTPYDLVCFNKLLEIQSYEQNEQELKWWSATDGRNSLFTTLIRLTVAVPPSSRARIQERILKFTETSLIFKKELLASPIASLVRLCNKINEKQVYTLMDLSLGYATKTPYKYLDMSHQEFGDVSPFIVALFEQYKFNRSKSVLEWLQVLSRELLIIGEPEDGLVKMWNKFIPEENIKEISLVHVKHNEDSFADFIMGKTVKELRKDKSLSQRVVFTSTDFAALWYFMKTANITSSENEVFADLASKAAQYMAYNVPSNKSLEAYIFKRPFWGSLSLSMEDLSSGLSVDTAFSSELLNEIYSSVYDVIDDTKRSQLQDTEYVKFILDCFHNSSDMAIASQEFLCKFSWILSSKAVLSLMDENVGKGVLKHLFELAIHRRLSLSVGSLIRVLESSELELSVFKIAMSYGLIQLDEQNLKKVVGTIIRSKFNIPLLKVLIDNQNNKQTLTEIILADKSQFLGTASSISIAAAISGSFNVEKVREEVGDDLSSFILEVVQYIYAFLESLENSEEHWQECLQVLSCGLQLGIADATESFDLVVRVIKKNSSSLAFNCQFVTFLQEAVKVDNLVPRAIPWIQGILLVVTKRFAELTKQNQSFDELIDSLIKLLSSLNSGLWSQISGRILDTQLEVILQHSQWILNELYLEYVCSIICCAKHSEIDASKFLQIFINNEANILTTNLGSASIRSYSGLIIFLLYFKNSKQAARSLQNNLICYYSGSLRPEDILLKQVLQDIEAKVNLSWVNDVARWDVAEELSESDLSLVTEEPLIKNSKDSLLVTISKNTINNTIRGGAVSDIETPAALSKIIQKQKVQTSDFLKEIKSFFTTKEIRLNGPSSYDPQFIAMVTLCHSELISLSTNENGDDVPVFNVRNIIETGILEILVQNIGNSAVLESVTRIIGGIAKSDAGFETYKDKVIFKVYLNIILNTIIKKVEIPNLVWNLYGALIPILRNPGHFMYDRAYRFVLSNPSLRAHDIPMYHGITKSQAIEGAVAGENYYKEISWLLEALTSGICSEDLRLIGNQGVLEWALDILNSPYTPPKTFSEILKFIYKIQSLDMGNDLLITKFGALGYIEQKQSDTKRWKNNVASAQFELNYKQLLLRFGTSQATKRTKEWTGGDNYVKRLCNRA